MKNHLTALTIVLIVFSLLFFILTGCDTSDDDPLEIITISSASPGGVYFPLGVGLAKVITDGVDGIFVQAQATGGSVDNVNLVADGDTDIGMAMANVAFEAWQGSGIFAGNPLPVKAVFTMYPSAQHLVVSADSDIYTVQDLAGKTVSMDAQGSGGEVTAVIILETAGLLEDVTRVNYLQQDAAEALINGSVDAVFYNFSYPGAVVEQLLLSLDIRFIPLPESLINDILTEYPYFTAGVIPSGTYHLTEDIATIMVDNLLFVHENMKADLVKDILGSIFNETAINELKAIHPVANFFRAETAGETIIPLHPGAEEFFIGVQ